MYIYPIDLVEYTGFRGVVKGKSRTVRKEANSAGQARATGSARLQSTGPRVHQGWIRVWATR